MATANNAIIQLSDLKDWLGVSGTQKDVILQNMINIASGAIEEFCQRKFKIQTITDEIYDGTGLPELNLRWAPIVGFPSDDIPGKDRRDDVLFRNAPTEAWQQLGVAKEEILLDPLRPYQIRLYMTVFPFGIQNIKVSYKAGYADIPQGVVEACYSLCQHLWSQSRQGDSWQGKSAYAENKGGVAVNTSLIEDMDEKIRKKLSYYRRFSLA